MGRKFGLIGYPLGHSFSKQYFTEKFEREGIQDCIYDTYPLESISELPALLQAQPELAGLNVTIPYKQQVLSYLNDSSNLPFEACNTIKIENGRLIGYNTDCIGFEKSFAPLHRPHQKSALILGNGGATLAVRYVLEKMGIATQVVSRQPGNGAALTYEALSDDLISRNHIIVNCTPLGTFPNVETCVPIPFGAITDQHYLFDLVYNPAKSLFLTRGEAAGATIQNGSAMLVGQAEAAWAIWNS